MAAQTLSVIHMFSFLPSLQMYQVVATAEPTAFTTTLAERVIVNGTWTDDFVYVDKDSVTDNSTSEIYDNGWYENVHSILLQKSADNALCDAHSQDRVEWQ